MLTATHDDHTRVRRLFSPAFSARSLKAQEPLFKKYADLLMFKISEVGEDGRKPVDIGALLNFTTFDVMAELTFGHNLNMLAKTEYSPWVSSIVGSLKMLPVVAFVNYYPLLRNTLFGRFQPKWIEEQRKKHCEFAEELVNKRIEVGSEKPDVWNLVMKDEGKGLTLEEMHSNAELFMLAGSETTGKFQLNDKRLSGNLTDLALDSSHSAERRYILSPQKPAHFRKTCERGPE